MFYILAILKYGIPDRGPVAMYYTNHVLSYDQARKTPVWVAEHITKDCIKGEHFFSFNFYLRTVSMFSIGLQRFLEFLAAITYVIQLVIGSSKRLKLVKMSKLHRDVYTEPS